MTRSATAPLPPRRPFPLHTRVALRAGRTAVHQADLGPVATATGPAVIVPLNLSREFTRGVPLQRTLKQWRTTLATTPPGRIVANVDDPLMAWAVAGAHAFRSLRARLAR